MYLVEKFVQPAEFPDEMCQQRGPEDKGTCTRLVDHSMPHVAHGSDGRHYYIVALWDDDRTTDH